MKVKEVISTDDYFSILFERNSGYIQRKEVTSATESPLGWREEIIIALCEALLRQKP